MDMLQPSTIRDARKAAGMTQAQLARKAGVSRATANRWEQTGCNKTKDMLAIANAVGLPLSELRKSAPQGPTILNHREQQVVDLMRDSPDAANAIWAFVAGLLASGNEASARSASRLNVSLARIREMGSSTRPPSPDGREW